MKKKDKYETIAEIGLWIRLIRLKNKCSRKFLSAVLEVDMKTLKNLETYKEVLLRRKSEVRIRRIYKNRKYLMKTNGACYILHALGLEHNAHYLALAIKEDKK